jgi:hypothetical protein
LSNLLAGWLIEQYNELVMDYRIRRLPPLEESRQYHLYDQENRLGLVADFGSPWLGGLRGSYVRFGLPSSDLVALMDVSVSSRKKNGRSHIAYAIQQNHAVSAILNKYQVGDKPPYFVIEADEQLWLALPQADQKHYLLYNEVPSDLMITNEPVTTSLPAPIGTIYFEIGEYDYQIVMPPQELNFPQLIMLALVFLIDE